LFEDKGCKTGKGTVQIKFDQEVPSTIIKRVLKLHTKMSRRKANNLKEDLASFQKFKEVHYEEKYRSLF